MRIAVAGGTGVIGTEVVRVAQQRGHRVRVLSRGNGVDVVSGIGLTEALQGIDAVIDVLSVATQNRRAATDFFTGTTTRLLSAERRAGIAHHLALLIVGVDRAPFGYYAGKLAQEQSVQAGGVPWTILRTAQFHEFAAQMHRRARLGPLHLAVRMRTQPVSLAEVGAELIDLVEAGPSGRARDLAGPREENLADMMKRWARHTGRSARMLETALPGRFGRALRAGAVLPGPDARLGTVAFDDWLAAQPHERRFRETAQ